MKIFVMVKSLDNKNYVLLALLLTALEKLLIDLILKDLIFQLKEKIRLSQH